MAGFFFRISPYAPAKAIFAVITGPGRRQVRFLTNMLSEACRGAMQLLRVAHQRDWGFRLYQGVCTRDIQLLRWHPFARSPGNLERLGLVPWRFSSHFLREWFENFIKGTVMLGGDVLSAPSPVSRRSVLAKYQS